MKKKALAAFIIVVAILAGCGKDTPVSNSSPIQGVTPEPVETESPSDDTEEPEPTDEPRMDNGFMMNGEKHPITERSEVSGKMQSYLTGEWKDADVVQRRSMAVMIPNNRLKVPGTDTYKTVPQHGISYASIIYEAPVEGRITRLMAIFEDYDDIQYIGPIRSSRDYYVYEAMAYDSIYCNWGLAVPYVAPIINTDRIDNVSQALAGIDVGSPEAYGNKLNSGYAQEFTSSMSIEGFNKAVERLGYATTYEDHGRFEQAFTFADDDYIATYEGYPEATVIYPGGTTSNQGGFGSNSGSNSIKFEYNEEDRLYYRYQYGYPQVDADNDEQLAVSNVVFKVCHGEVRDDHDYLAFRVHGTGTAYIFTNGKVIEGTWQRNSDYEANIFLDADGNEIVLNQGKTWICNIWEEYSEYASWE